jgi:hypothetical protein
MTVGSRPPPAHQDGRTRGSSDSIRGSALRAGHLAASCIPFRADQTIVAQLESDSNRFFRAGSPGPSAFRRPASPWGMWNCRWGPQKRQINGSHGAPPKSPPFASPLARALGRASGMSPALSTFRSVPLTIRRGIRRRGAIPGCAMAWPPWLPCAARSRPPRCLGRDGSAARTSRRRCQGLRC